MEFHQVPKKPYLQYRSQYFFIQLKNIFLKENNMQISWVVILAVYSSRPIHNTKSSTHSQQLIAGSYLQVNELYKNKFYIRCQWNFQSVVNNFFYLRFAQLNLGYKSCYLCQSFGKNGMYLLNIFNKSPHPTLRNDIFKNSTSHALS